MELQPRYEHAGVEARWYALWEESGAFRPEATGEQGEPYSIVIPPPNVTGKLHVGHALNHTIQDVLIRAARKQGRRALWIPGTDHAGIATQSRVERNLAAEGANRHDLGREKFLQRVWQWKEESGGEITNQMRTLGQSPDWSREQFTMSPELSRAVTKVFVELYNEGLIYRGERIINWSPPLATALANDEVEHEERDGHLWYFRYPLADGSGSVVVATTRPETMLGDTGVAVHPNDERYKAFIGKKVRLPLMDREIPVVGDDAIDPEFGTGAVKVTPAHDPTDFEIGRRHDLPAILIMDDHARINANGGAYVGMDRYAARKQVVADMEGLGLLEKTEPYRHSVGLCYRTGEVIEPILSKQWFVRVRPLADNAIEAVRDGRITFFPKRWENLYFDWLERIQDWCISRQLWWGHRIPVYTCAKCAHELAAEEGPAECPKCASKDLTQDPDVLDTWFSSALWPFSTLGWPDQTPELKLYYPTTVLSTAFDIIFFWVARMVMMGLHFMKEPPFRHVYMHGLMRDEKGRKISKSLGNNIDPLDEAKEFGADAYRFFLMATLSEGKDSVYSRSRLKGYQAFANKVWNSARFVLMNMPEDFVPVADVRKLKLEDEDWWILARLAEAIKETEESIGTYRFHVTTEQVYGFVWNHFCDWYIELVKPRMFGKSSPDSVEAARQTVYFVLLALLGLLHPFMPFVTEEIYSFCIQFGKKRTGREALLITAAWPVVPSLPKKALAASASLELVREIIGKSRTIRSEAGIAPDRKVSIVVSSPRKDLSKVLAANETAILRLAQAEKIEVRTEYEPGKHDAVERFSEGEVFLPLEGLLDIAKERKRLQDDAAKTTQFMESVRKKLAGSGFRANAPAEVVEKEEAKLVEFEAKLATIQSALKRLG